MLIPLITYFPSWLELCRFARSSLSRLSSQHFYAFRTQLLLRTSFSSFPYFQSLELNEVIFEKANSNAWAASHTTSGSPAGSSAPDSSMVIAEDQSPESKIPMTSPSSLSTSLGFVDQCRGEITIGKSPSVTSLHVFRTTSEYCCSVGRQKKYVLWAKRVDYEGSYRPEWKSGEDYNKELRPSLLQHQVRAGLRRHFPRLAESPERVDFHCNGSFNIVYSVTIIHEDTCTDFIFRLALPVCPWYSVQVRRVLDSIIVLPPPDSLVTV